MRLLLLILNQILMLFSLSAFIGLIKWFWNDSVWVGGGWILLSLALFITFLLNFLYIERGKYDKRITG